MSEILDSPGDRLGFDVDRLARLGGGGDLYALLATRTLARVVSVSSLADDGTPSRRQLNRSVVAGLRASVEAVLFDGEAPDDLLTVVAVRCALDGVPADRHAVVRSVGSMFEALLENLDDEV